MSDTVNFDGLSRQEKRELAQRFSDVVRSKLKTRPPEREEGAGLSVKELITKELLELRGIDACVGMIKSIVPGTHIGYIDLIFEIEDGRLAFKICSETNFNVATKQKMANILDRDRILKRLKQALFTNG
ncbi:TPA: hypothetical protein JLS84_000420 [Escherichia coli]|uniref:hypothetical protein n=1 Tax=Escherichia coli TaxID=562 RepID=UPI003F281CB2|nr:hypothetical protein [Escherichia coli]